MTTWRLIKPRCINIILNGRRSVTETTTNNHPADPGNDAQVSASGEWETNAKAAFIKNCIAGGVAVALLGTIAYVLMSPALKCNSPGMLHSFQQRFETNRDKLAALYQTKGLDASEIFRKKLNIISTLTVGKEGQLVGCLMRYNYHASEEDREWAYIVTKNDNGGLISRYDDPPPYEIR
jgi:hypothetical protein